MLLKYILPTLEPLKLKYLLYLITYLGTPADPLQYLSQLEIVARKLKDQLIKQKQVQGVP